MKKKSVKLIVSLFLVMAVSCDEPETVVTNYVHPDGSVTRKIEMRNSKNKFEPEGLQVPFDNTWLVKDTIEIGSEGDTTWIKTAEKLFNNVDEINLTYKIESDINKEISRHAGFNKRFKWFNTEYRFSETIDKKLECDYPLKDFLNEEELSYFYSPESLNYLKQNGQDSLKYRALSDSVNLKTEAWVMKIFVAEWIDEFSKLVAEKAGNDITREWLKEHEHEFLKIVEANDEGSDSLWTEGVLLKEFIGEDYALKYKTEADTAIEKATDNVFLDVKTYSVRIMMPGKVIGTNGFIDSSKILIWPVKSDYFLTESYEMWAESKVPNRWAWIISGLFLVFVLTGVIIRIIKRG